jgi:hypothetical protein
MRLMAGMSEALYTPLNHIEAGKSQRQSRAVAQKHMWWSQCTAAVTTRVCSNSATSGPSHSTSTGVSDEALYTLKPHRSRQESKAIARCCSKHSKEHMVVSWAYGNTVL